VFAWATSAQAQFPSLGGMLGPSRVPGSAPSRVMEEELEIGPYAKQPYGGSDSTSSRYTGDDTQKYFEGRVADSYFEDPSCSGINDRVCYGYFAADALYWDRVRSTSKTMAVLSTTGAVALRGADLIWNDPVVIPRLTAGWVFDNGWSVEGSYFYKDNADTQIQATNPGILSMNAFGTPSAAFAPNFFQADAIGVSSSVALQNVEVNAIQTNNYFNIIAGFRWLELQDRLWLTVYKGGTLSDTHISTYNKLFGPQLGLRMSQTFYGIYGVEFQVKGGYYVNYGRVNTSITNAGAGLPDQTRQAHGNSDAAVAEAHLMGTYNPYIWWQLRLGIQVFSVWQTALANDQIFNNNASTGFAMQEKSDLIYWGPFAGSEFRW
jgi:hypothetical protein